MNEATMKAINRWRQQKCTYCGARPTEGAHRESIPTGYVESDGGNPDLPKGKKVLVHRPGPMKFYCKAHRPAKLKRSDGVTWNHYKQIAQSVARKLQVEVDVNDPQLKIRYESNTPISHAVSELGLRG